MKKKNGNCAVSWKSDGNGNAIFYALPKPLKRERAWTGITGRLHTPKDLRLFYELFNHQLWQGTSAFLSFGRFRHVNRSSTGGPPRRALLRFIQCMINWSSSILIGQRASVASYC
jgi:hypothetical protein